MNWVPCVGCSVLRNMYDALCDLLCVVCGVQFINAFTSEKCLVFSLQKKMCSMHYEVYSVQHSYYSVQFSVVSDQCSVFSVQCAVCSV